MENFDITNELHLIADAYHEQKKQERQADVAKHAQYYIIPAIANAAANGKYSLKLKKKYKEYSAVEIAACLVNMGYKVKNKNKKVYVIW